LVNINFAPQSLLFYFKKGYLSMLPVSSMGKPTTLFCGINPVNPKLHQTLTEIRKASQARTNDTYEQVKKAGLERYQQHTAYMAAHPVTRPALPSTPKIDQAPQTVLAKAVMSLSNTISQAGEHTISPQSQAHIQHQLSSPPTEKPDASGLFTTLFDQIKRSSRLVGIK
jgi:hypothetical protein